MSTRIGMSRTELAEEFAAIIGRLEVLAATSDSHTATAMLWGEEVTCLVKYSTGAHADKVYWRRNGDRVSSRSLRRYFQSLSGLTAGGGV